MDNKKGLPTPYPVCFHCQGKTEKIKEGVYKCKDCGATIKTVEAED